MTTENMTKEREFLETVLKEVQLSRSIYPKRGFQRWAGFIQEVGETFQAWGKHLIRRTPESWIHLAHELKQTAGTIVRLIVEGDSECPAIQGGPDHLHHISECVPDYLKQDTSINAIQRELDAYHALGNARELKEALAKKEEMARFLKESLAIMELNSQLTIVERGKRFEAEERLAKTQEALEDIVTQLSGHPDAGDGNKKVHFCLLRAQGALEGQNDVIGIHRVERERDDAAAAAGWLAHVVLNDHGGSETHTAWIARGTQYYRDALLRVDRHRHIMQFAAEELRKHALAGDACPVCTATMPDGKHDEKCSLHNTILALEQAAIPER